MLDRAQLYQRVGGETVVRALVDRFYDLMDTEAHFKTLRALHPRLLHSSREKLFLYLTGWLGGPQTYVERYGHPRLRARHMPFSIGDDERDQWMRCMTQALDEHVPDVELRAFLVANLQSLADHMRNRAP